MARRGAMPPDQLWRLGLAQVDAPLEGVHSIGAWWVDGAALQTWAPTLRQAVERLGADPLTPGLSEERRSRS
ncbi:MAG: hypothetical protein U0R67_10145 [Micropruina glycogenica]